MSITKCIHYASQSRNSLRCFFQRLEVLEPPEVVQGLDHGCSTLIGPVQDLVISQVANAFASLCTYTVFLNWLRPGEESLH